MHRSARVSTAPTTLISCVELTSGVTTQSPICLNRFNSLPVVHNHSPSLQMCVVIIIRIGLVLLRTLGIVNCYPESQLACCDIPIAFETKIDGIKLATTHS